MAEEKKIDILRSGLVSKHELIGEEEKSEFLKNYNISVKQLPRIHVDDPAIKNMDAKRGSVIRITRKDVNVGEYYYYRVVV
jgi:DNA-directed RNA polymerase subunit H (RpoH/RPB5)